MADSLVADLAPISDRLDPDDGFFYWAKDSVDHRVTARQILRSAIPSADELSTGTNFADYIGDELAASGIVQLPPGPDPIVVTGKTNLYRMMGGIIQGCGAHQKSLFDETGFNDLDTASRFATVIRTTNSSQPIFDMDGCSNVTLQNFGLEGDSDYLIHYHNSNASYPSNYCKFINLSFHPYANTTSGKWAIQAGLTAAEENFNAADLEIHGCSFFRIGMLKVKHLQGVNYHFSGQTTNTYTPVGFLFEQGGRLVVDNLFTYGAETILKVIAGGGNVRTYHISNLNCDRVPSVHAPPVIVDFNSCTGTAAAIIDVVKVTYGLNDDTLYPGRYAYLLPSHHASSNTIIQVNNLGTGIHEGEQGTHTYPAGTSFVPTVAANPFD